MAYNIVVLQDSSGIEIVNEGFILVMSIYILDLLDEATALGIAVTDRVEADPERD